VSTALPPSNVARAVALGVCMAGIAALAVVLLAVVAADQLPPIVSGQSWTDLGSAMSWLAVVLIAASIAVVLLAIDGQNRFENVMRYRRMLEEPHNEANRELLLRMLAEEERRLDELAKSAP
jgi:hypothetical protein